MDYYSFKISKQGKEVVQSFKKIKNDNIEFILYDTYLKEFHGVGVEYNEDYLPFCNNRTKEVLMILAEDLFDITDLEEVFDCMTNYFEEEGEFIEASNNSKCVS
jgi:hypothetical protein